MSSFFLTRHNVLLCRAVKKFIVVNPTLSFKEPIPRRALRTRTSLGIYLLSSAATFFGGALVSFELSRINERAAWAFCLPSREGIEFVGLFRDALIPIRPGAVGADASMVDVLGAISATCLRNSWCESFAWYPVGALGVTVRRRPPCLRAEASRRV